MDVTGTYLTIPQRWTRPTKTHSPGLARSEETTSRSLRDIWLTDCKPSTASTSFVWLPFSANTIMFTYHPLFELFFHRSYLKTTTVGKMIHWKLCKRLQFDHTDANQYIHKPETVLKIRIKTFFSSLRKEKNLGQTTKPSYNNCLWLESFWDQASQSEN